MEYKNDLKKREIEITKLRNELYTPNHESLLKKKLTTTEFWNDENV